MRTRAHEIFSHLQQDVRALRARPAAEALLLRLRPAIPPDVHCPEALARWLPVAAHRASDLEHFARRDAAVAALVRCAADRDEVGRLAQSVLVLAFRGPLRSTAIRLSAWLRACGAEESEVGEVDATVVAAFIEAVASLDPERGARTAATLLMNARRRAVGMLARDRRWTGATTRVETTQELDEMLWAELSVSAAGSRPLSDRAVAERFVAEYGPDAELIVGQELVGLELTEIAAVRGVRVDALYKRVERLRSRARNRQGTCPESAGGGAYGSPTALVH